MRGWRWTQHRLEQLAVRRPIGHVPLAVHVHDQHLPGLLVVGGDWRYMRPVPIARKDALIEIHEDDVLIAGLVGRKRLSQSGERFWRIISGPYSLYDIILKVEGSEALAPTATNSAKEAPLPPLATSSPIGRQQSSSAATIA